MFLATDCSRDWPADSAAVWLYKRRGSNPIKKSWWACFHKRHPEVMRNSKYTAIRRLAIHFDVIAARAAMDSITCGLGATP